MRLEWIEDILAILDAGSLNRAAEQRYLTQPAFSRRIKSIENYVGAELLDRTRKPARLRKQVLEQQQRLENLASGLRGVLNDLRDQDRKIGRRVVVASQHSITTSIASSLIRQLSPELEINVRLRSANRDECFAMLLTKQADLMLNYSSADEQLPRHGSFLEECDMGDEDLIPVFATNALASLNVDRQRGKLPVIVYPANVFLGKVMNQKLLPRLRTQAFLSIKAETALTLAALQLALAGVGVAWVPSSLASKEISDRNLTDLSHVFGKATLSLGALRLVGPKSAAEQEVWNVIGRLAK